MMRRGEIIGQSDEPVAGEAEHYRKCPRCGGWVDVRDLGALIEHGWPGTVCPKQDRPQ